MLTIRKSSLHRVLNLIIGLRLQISSLWLILHLSLLDDIKIIILEVTNLDKAWTKLVNGLSGQFCASLNFLDTTQAVSPKWSFQPRGITPYGFNSSEAAEHFRSGTLPGENVCTENLTPWKKLLPCESKRGMTLISGSQPFFAREPLRRIRKRPTPVVSYEKALRMLES